MTLDNLKDYANRIATNPLFSAYLSGAATSLAVVIYLQGNWESAAPEAILAVASGVRAINQYYFND